ncbi:MAG TPA: hypothetical protein VFV98_14935, partial [Vicinamibacterales bacterium]|nr:hypothetical protein [Vicinamibacterales bacterium]
MRAFASALVVIIAIASVARARLVFAPDPTATEDVHLRNGLHVILAPDPSAASVVVHVRYESGAASERPSEAGYTKLVEKLMSAG